MCFRMEEKCKASQEEQWYCCLQGRVDCSGGYEKDLAAERKEKKLDCFYEMKSVEEMWKAKSVAEDRTVLA